MAVQHFSRHRSAILCQQNKVVQIWPGLFVCKSSDTSPGHIWTTLDIGVWSFKQKTTNENVLAKNESTAL